MHPFKQPQCQRTRHIMKNFHKSPSKLVQNRQKIFGQSSKDGTRSSSQGSHRVMVVEEGGREGWRRFESRYNLMYLCTLPHGNKQDIL